MTSSICEIEKLVDLFSLERQSDDDEEQEANIQKKENVVAETKEAGKPNETKNVRKNLGKNPYAKLETDTKNKDIFDPEEYFVNEDAPSTSNQKDWKKTPIWDITYKQKVSAEDVFLGMGFKNPSTSSCENMIVTVYLPGENHHNIDLKVEEKSLILDSPKFYLVINLPQPVDPKRGGADFDKDNEKLVITLILNREFDFLNF